MARKRLYRLWTYDVWGNAEDGYCVNDRCKRDVFAIPVTREVHNKGTEHEFVTEDPTDRQLSKAVGCSVKNTRWDGESDYTLYAEDERTGEPLCELEFEGWQEEE